MTAVLYNNNTCEYTLETLQEYNAVVIDAKQNSKQSKDLYLLQLQANSFTTIELDFYQFNKSHSLNTNTPIKFVIAPQLTPEEGEYWNEIAQHMNLGDNTIVLSGRVIYSETNSVLISCGGLCVKITSNSPTDFAANTNLILHQLISIFMTFPQ